MPDFHAFLVRRAAPLALAFGAGSFPLLATPPLDPICGAPSSLASVLSVRAWKPVMDSLQGGGRRLQQADRRPELSILRTIDSRLPTLVLRGTAGRVHHLETSTDLAGGPWTPRLSAILPDQPLTWIDQDDNGPGSRFYRLRTDSGEPADDWVSNFRLLDAEGVTRDLYYHTHRSAVAIITAGTQLDEVASVAPILDELQRRHTNRLETWILLSDPAPARSNILAQAKGLGIRFPILLDRDGLAARSVGLSRAGEVAVVRTPEFACVYRGEVVGPDRTSADRTLLGQALAGVLDGGSITFVRTPALGPVLPHLGEEMPSYAREIAPILHQYCARCHRPGGVAPFALTNHSVAADKAPSIKHAVLSGQMPPWHADPEYGKFANDLSLPGHLKSALVRWIDGGAARGDGPDPLAEQPPPPAFERWPEELGPPDALVTVPLQSVKAEGTEPYRYLFVRAPNPEDVWLKAAIVRPSNYRTVHHYLVWLGRKGNNGTPNNSTYESHIAEFVPGYEPFRFPADAGMLLSRSNWLTFNLHYTPIGVETNDQPVLALWYHRSKPPKTWVAFGPANNTFSIPPGAADHRVQATWDVVTRSIEIHRLNPHMHLRGKRMKYEVRYPNGLRETLLSVPDYDFNWQVGYALAEPKVIPVGSQLIITGAFDNSPQNLANPDPTDRVKWGDQSWMEMFVGFIDSTE